MRTVVSIVAAVCCVAGSVLLARGGMRPAECSGRESAARSAALGQPSAQEPPREERRLINTKADLMGPVAPGDTAIFLVGNFAAQHNGAVITCDSAVRYSDMHLEFFGNVLINKNTTYIYGDRAVYDGNINRARVYSDLVKVIDGDAVLYTYTFYFDTKENIGRFDDGGVLVNREHMLEAVRGYYYADTKELIGVGSVQMRNDEYELSGDSVVYDMAADNAHFFENTNIWSRDGDYLYADRGSYLKADTLYRVTRNGYILTEKQEVWSDSIDYFRPAEHAVLRGDIQLDDSEHKVLGFGDYGEYWKYPGDALLTRRPATISYDLSQGDSLFMRADTIRFFTVIERAAEPGQAGGADSLAAEYPQLPDSLAAEADRAPERGDAPLRQLQRSRDDGAGLLPGDPLADELPDDAPAPSDSLAADRGVELPDSLAADTVRLTPAQLKAQQREETRRARQALRAEQAAIRRARLDSMALRRQERTTARLLAIREREEVRLAARRLKADSKLRARQERARRKGKKLPADSTLLHRLDAMLDRNAAERDSLQRLLADEWSVDSAALFLPAQDSTAAAPFADTMYRLMKGYRNVKIYRSDFQSVCDSMTAISTDSTLHLYIDPVLWNQNNQVTSDAMDIYTLAGQVDHADFVGRPMMVAELDTLHYNQIKGKTMTAWFVDNAIARNEVNGNAETLYYMQDGEPAEVVMLGVVESGGIVFYFEERQVVRIVWTNNPVYNLYPIDKIPDEVELFLPDFRWEGARRPSQREVFDRSIRPSERQWRSGLRRPDFPMHRRMEEHRRRLVEMRRWADRSDRVDMPTVEWMRSLGYVVESTGPVAAPVVMMDPSDLAAGDAALE